jgi:hypothetical protein
MADFSILEKEVKDWQESTAWMTIRHPRTGEPIGDQERPARICLASPQSERWQRLEKSYHAQLRLARQNGQTVYTVDDVERFEQHRVQCYQAVTRDWQNIERNGEVLPCTPASMEWMYGMKWIADQLLEFMSDVRNWGAPEGTENLIAPDPMLDSEKKLSIGSSGTLQ